MKNTVDLFRIFQHEQKRVGDSMTVYYNIEENSLQYKNTKGTLTVIFHASDAGEDFYYQKFGELVSENGKKLGILVQKIYHNGQNAHLFQNPMTGGLKMFEIPQEFIDIARAYQFDRESIGLKGETA